MTKRQIDKQARKQISDFIRRVDARNATSRRLEKSAKARADLIARVFVEAYQQPVQSPYTIR
jgi:hypothetical protein